MTGVAGHASARCYSLWGLPSATSTICSPTICRNAPALQVRTAALDKDGYQVRRALEANEGHEAVDFEPFKATYDEISRKLRPQVFELGFLCA